MMPRILRLVFSTLGAAALLAPPFAAGAAGVAAVAGSGAPVPAPGPGAYPDLGPRAMEHLLAQCAFGPRDPGSPGHAQARDYIRRTLEEAGGRVTLQTFRHTSPGLPEPVELTNVIARFGPLREGGLLLGAHWDTRPWADRDPDPANRNRPILGANDGASGTGLLLALAEGFEGDPPLIPVLLVFFDGEDLGREDHPEEYLAGSSYFAQNLPGPYPEMGLVVDMVASRTMSLTLEQNARNLHADFGMLIDELAVRMEVDAYDPSWGPALIDDHIPLLQAGLPTLCLVDFRDPTWHTLQDRPEHCSAASLGAAGRIVQALVRGGYLR